MHACAWVPPPALPRHVLPPAGVAVEPGLLVDPGGRNELLTFEVCSTSAVLARGPSSAKWVQGDVVSAPAPLDMAACHRAWREVGKGIRAGCGISQWVVRLPQRCTAGRRPPAQRLADATVGVADALLHGAGRRTERAARGLRGQRGRVQRAHLAGRSRRPVRRSRA